MLLLFLSQTLPVQFWWDSSVWERFGGPWLGAVRWAQSALTLYINVQLRILPCPCSMNPLWFYPLLMAIQNFFLQFLRGEQSCYDLASQCMYVSALWKNDPPNFSSRTSSPFPFHVWKKDLVWLLVSSFRYCYLLKPRSSSRSTSDTARGFTTADPKTWSIWSICTTISPTLFKLEGGKVHMAFNWRHHVVEVIVVPSWWSWTVTILSHFCSGSGLYLDECLQTNSRWSWSIMFSVSFIRHARWRKEWTNRGDPMYAAASVHSHTSTLEWYL